jgi:outer membrane protein OmpA-like peptidoglycan-associated protein
MSYRNAYEKYIPRFFQHSIVMNYAFRKSDLDNDGIPDAKDNCPEEPGLKQFNGCPDSDGDTLPDKDDKCPYIAGNPKLKGCLDSDGDGLIDPEDRCPKRYGSNNMYGCPDTDGDGISDAEDVCMDLIGPIENRGCPWPDSDQDGIPDKDDLCLDEPGLIENNGCPELNNEIMEALNQIASQINFVANSDLIIGQKTRTILDEIIKLLQENPKGKISIEGYASSDGDSNFNKALSIKRAEAVLEYLITGGIEQYRLEIRGYGEEYPISTNQTPEGRAVNRRVQFRAIKEK